MRFLEDNAYSGLSENGASIIRGVAISKRIQVERLILVTVCLFVIGT